MKSLRLRRKQGGVCKKGRIFALLPSEERMIGVRVVERYFVKNRAVPAVCAVEGCPSPPPNKINISSTIIV